MSHSKLSVSEGKDYVSSAVWYKYSQQQQQTQTQTGSNPATRIKYYKHAMWKCYRSAIHSLIIDYQCLD